MDYGEAMTQMKAGRVARRTGWKGHVRVEGLRMVRVEPDKVPATYRATPEDQAATDWTVAGTPATSPGAEIEVDILSSELANNSPHWLSPEGKKNR